MHPRARASLFVAFAALAVARHPAAGEAEKRAAEALFQDAKRLLQKGETREACAKFQESQRIDPAVGTLLFLGDCHESLGKTASAWSTFREAEALARRLGRGDRAEAARARAETLEAKLVRLAVRVTAQQPGLVVREDGATLPPTLWGADVPVDPGEHLVEATAPGKKPYRVTVIVTAANVSVVVPALEDAAPPPPPPATSSAELPPRASESPPAARPPAPPEPRAHAKGPYVVLGVGALGVVVGSVYGARAFAKWSASRDHCREGNVCTRAGLGEIEDAKSAARVSTAAFAVGLVGVAAGGAWLFVDTGRPRAAQVGVRGRF